MSRARQNDPGRLTRPDGTARGADFPGDCRRLWHPGLEWTESEPARTVGNSRDRLRLVDSYPYPCGIPRWRTPSARQTSPRTPSVRKVATRKSAELKISCFSQPFYFHISQSNFKFWLRSFNSLFYNNKKQVQKNKLKKDWNLENRFAKYVTSRESTLECI